VAGQLKVEAVCLSLDQQREPKRKVGYHDHEKGGIMQTATIEEVQAQLPTLLEQVAKGEEVVIVSAGEPVGRLIPPGPTPAGRILGRGRGKLISYVDDDEHLKDFEDYMP
jgi:prevent-host-death family protein